MSLVNWITSNPDAAVAIVGGVVTFIWNKARGKKTDDLWDTLLQLGRQAFPKLLRDAHLFDDAYVRARLNAAIWQGLERLKVKRSKLVEGLVDEVVEHLVGELASKVIDLGLSEYIKTSKETSGTIAAHLKATEAPTP